MDNETKARVREAFNLPTILTFLAVLIAIVAGFLGPARAAAATQPGPNEEFALSSSGYVYNINPKTNFSWEYEKFAEELLAKPRLKFELDRAQPTPWCWFGKVAFQLRVAVKAPFTGRVNWIGREEYAASRSGWD
ncbi:MAG: hypothetical protein A3A33_04365 [Candidatus Yanofskybacteria bacterium RIFCSPLOWO2_01_FULL_49_25]|uniref:Uncharacterized protein n=1 Tax=Candidatus Yanofskybacteria bacterium RIFCSPLOWO2_01_FULL_49_25 TaxID=1802701 RepID=A0A1F8GYF0_9BACT|nr:MAG: hypothetical protein A3A33_04365 [Candidatus Yanofskybacteria bacterium RIFCSPLOWO2_01_FULL_49_25]